MGWAHAAPVPGRMGPTKMSLEHFLAWGFLCTPSSSPKKDALIFPELSEAVAAAELLILSGEGGITAIIITSPPWRGRRPLHQHHHQYQHHLRIHSVPLIV